MTKAKNKQWPIPSYTPKAPDVSSIISSEKSRIPSSWDTQWKVVHWKCPIDSIEIPERKHPDLMWNMLTLMFLVVVYLTSNSWKLEIDAGTWTLEINSNVKRQAVATANVCYVGILLMWRCHALPLPRLPGDEIDEKVRSGIPWYTRLYHLKLGETVRQSCMVPYGCVQQIKLSFRVFWQINGARNLRICAVSSVRRK